MESNSVPIDYHSRARLFVATSNRFIPSLLSLYLAYHNNIFFTDHKILGIPSFWFIIFLPFINNRNRCFAEMYTTKYRRSEEHRLGSEESWLGGEQRR